MSEEKGSGFGRGVKTAGLVIPVFLLVILVWKVGMFLVVGVTVAVVLGLIGVLAALVLAIWAFTTWRRRFAVARFRAAWAKQGRDLLLVTSNSPHWQEYVERTWLPRWGARAVVLNWSERATWNKATPEVRLFRVLGGSREFNPLAIVVPARGGSPTVVRFWKAFRDHKHGRTRTLEARERELEAALAGRGPDAVDAAGGTD